MTLEEFVARFAQEFDETPAESIKSDTNFRELEEWGSLLGLSVISMIDDEFDVVVTGAEIRSCKSVEDLYRIVISKL